ncbi:MAG: TonB-dependent receptor [Candidatus Latescibacteria bacterium]|nr:TonB-dependent receptor [Candidatus Latescibacterota bacterium]
MKNGRRLIVLILLFSFFTWIISAQETDTGTITGTIVDSSTGEPMVGAVVQIEGTKIGIVCDLDGKFRLTRVPVGTYSLKASMIGYVTKTITDLEVKKDEVIKIDFAISSEAIEIEEVVVKAQAVRDTEASLLKDRQKSESVSDAISAESISRSGSGNAAEAMKQVTGASVVDGKHVYVRGLGDRYTSIQLNGSEIPSADPYKRSAPMDLFPSNLVDNIVTLKSFTPDKPGNFSGGTVNVETKNFPDTFTMSFSASSALNSQTTFEDGFLSYSGGDSDWLGMDDGTRDIPSELKNIGPKDIPDLGSSFSNIDKAKELDKLTKTFSSVMTPSERSAPLNQSYAFSLGNQVEVLDRPFGFLGSFSYKRSYSSYNNGTSGRWILTGNVDDTSTLSNDYLLKDTKSTEEVLWGGLLKASYKITPKNIVGINYVHNQNGENVARYLKGSFPYDLPENAVYETSVLQYHDRSLKTVQLNGDHHLDNLWNTRVAWKSSFSKAKQDEPDLRYFTNNYTEQERVDEDGNPYIKRFYKIRDNQPPSRYYRFMDETHKDLSLDISVPFKQWKGKDSILKFGGFYATKDRDFSERLFTFKQMPTYSYDGNSENLFSESNMGLLDDSKKPYQFGLFVIETYQPSSNYKGDQTISAAYGMIDMPLVDRLRFIGGARYEVTDMQVASQDTTKKKGKLNTHDVLPSLNLVYELKPSMNIRAAYGRTLARPSFREMAPYASFDFWGDFIFLGNENLKSTLIDNYDLRWEWFVRPGEIYAISAFIKNFDKPIERVIENINGEIRFRNVDKAIVRGLEFELRKRLDTLNRSLKNFQIGGNLSLVYSKVDISEQELATIRAFDSDAPNSREFQGQSPYIINIDLTYDSEERGITTSLYYNVFGERLAEISLGGTPDVYEQPLHLLNLSFSKQITKRISLKASGNNLLDGKESKVHTYQGVDYIRSDYRQGRSFSLGFNYKI